RADGRRRSGVGDRQLRSWLVEELFVFGRTLERGGRGLADLHRLRDRLEVTGSDLALMLDRSETLRRRREFGFLQLDKRGHLVMRVAVCQVEHRVVEAVEPGKRDELELVAHRAKLPLEPCHSRIVEVLLPVE